MLREYSSPLCPFPGLDIFFSQSPNSMGKHSLLSTLARTIGRRPMDRWASKWWDHLRIQPRYGRHELVLVREHVEMFRRLAVDIKDGFRGYVLTQEPASLAPLTEAEAKIDQALSNATKSLPRVSGSPNRLAPIEQRLKDLLQSKH